MNNYKHIQNTPQNESEWLHALVSLARFLRGPDGCPWDRKQTAESFAGYIQEEAGEFLEALRESDGNEHAEEEWGDVLFTLFATLAAAESEGRFSLENAVRRAHEKMIRRHGHIFGDYKAESPEEVLDVWRKIKEQEKQDKSTQNETAVE